MRQWVIAGLIACLLISAGLLTSQTTKKPSRAGITASSSPSGDYTTKTVQIVDYYPETADGKRQIYVAIIYQNFV